MQEKGPAMNQHVVTFLLGEVNHDVRGEMFKPAAGKSAPEYTQRAIPRQVSIGHETVLLAGKNVTFHVGGYPPDVLLVRATIEVADIFGKDVFDIERQALEHAQRIFSSYAGNPEAYENYSVFTIAGYDGEPEQFLDHAPQMAALLKSERMELDPREVDYTLRWQIKYGRNDLSIIDWDGAFLFDQEGDFEEDIELLTLANLQLLRHRILDRQLDTRLEAMGELVDRPFGRGRWGPWAGFRSKFLVRDLIEVMKNRMLSISQLQRLDREIKLIGDWYSARFFELATNKFKLDDWRQSILGKLDLLEDIYSIISENFAISWKSRAEWAQIILFFVLQGLWFFLIYLELIAMKH